MTDRQTQEKGPAADPRKAAAAPAEDLASCDAMAQTTLALYARDGDLTPFSIVEAASGQRIIVPSEGLADGEEKSHYVNLLRHVSIAHRGLRTAFAFEAWTMLGIEPGDVELLHEIYARGGSMREHPKAGEALIVIVESDAGTTTRTHRILRDGRTVTLAQAEDQFDAAGGDGRPSGRLSHFHVPTALQSRPEARAFSDAVAMMSGGVVVPVEPADPATPAARH